MTKQIGNTHVSLLSIGDVTKRTNQGLRFSPNKKQRIEDAEKANAILESSPTKLHEGYTHDQLMKLRERMPLKEIGPPAFRYTAQNYLEKITDVIQHKNCVSFT